MKIKIDKSLPVTHRDMISWSPEQKLERTDFFVEASHAAVQDLWLIHFHNNKKKDRLNWVQDGSGFFLQIGTVTINRKKKPVCVSMFWWIIGTKYVCFYEATSAIVDHNMVEEFFTKNYPVKYDGDRRAMVDHSNFHNCLGFCEAAEPKETIVDKFLKVDKQEQLISMLEETIQKFNESNDKEYRTFERDPDWKGKYQKFSQELEQIKKDNKNLIDHIRQSFKKQIA